MKCHFLLYLKNMNMKVGGYFGIIVYYLLTTMINYHIIRLNFIMGDGDEKSILQPYYSSFYVL